jgi:hypothetical protein
MAAISIKQRHPGLRWALLGGVICTALLTIYGLLRYPATLTITDESLVLLAMGITLILYVSITLYGTRAAIQIDQQVARFGTGFGILIGILWMTEVLSGNLGDPSNPVIMVLYRGCTLLVILSALFAGMISSRKSGRLRSACLVGVWSGLINGLLTAITALLMTYIFMDILKYNAQNVQEFLRNPQGAPDIMTFLTGDIIVASMSHLLIGPILGVVLGGIGGLLGKGWHITERQTS